MGWRRGTTRQACLAAALIALAFATTAAPYARYLTALNGGQFTPVSAEKTRYDALEGISTAVEGHRVAAFCSQYGPPGLGRIPTDDPWVRQALAPGGDNLRKLFWWSVGQAPANMLLATENWWAPVLLLALLFLVLEGGDPRVQGLGLLFLPIPLVAFTASWDPAPRYFAFSAPALALLAAPLVVRVWDGRLELGRAHQRLFTTAFFIALFAAWYVPDPLASELNTGTPFDTGLRAALAGGEAIKWGILAGALVLGRFLPTRLAALLMACLAVVAIGLRLQPGLPWAAAWGEAAFVPVSLVAMAVAMATAWMTLPRPQASLPASPGEDVPTGEWRQFLSWAATWMLLLSLQQAQGRAALDLSYRRIHCSDEVASCLQERPDWSAVVSVCQLDVIRAGKRWVAMPAEGLKGLAAVMKTSGADAVVLRTRTDTMPESLASLAPGARLVRVRSFPAAGLAADPGWEWVIYAREAPPPHSLAPGHQHLLQRQRGPYPCPQSSGVRPRECTRWALLAR